MEISKLAGQLFNKTELDKAINIVGQIEAQVQNNDKNISEQYIKVFVESFNVIFLQFMTYLQIAEKSRLNKDHQENFNNIAIVIDKVFNNKGEINHNDILLVVNPKLLELMLSINLINKCYKKQSDQKEIEWIKGCQIFATATRESILRGLEEVSKIEKALDQIVIYDNLKLSIHLNILKLNYLKDLDKMTKEGKNPLIFIKEQIKISQCQGIDFQIIKQSIMEIIGKFNDQHIDQNGLKSMGAMIFDIAMKITRNVYQLKRLQQIDKDTATETIITIVDQMESFKILIELQIKHMIDLGK